MHFTEIDIQNWIQENLAQLTSERLAFPSVDVQMMNKAMPELSAKIWNISCWIEAKLQEFDFEKQKIIDIQFAYGQRCFMATNLYAPALAYVNEAYETKDVREKSGLELAAKLFEETFEETFGET